MELTQSDGKGKQKAVPASADRPTIDSVIDELLDQDWYKEQLQHRRTIEAKEGQIGADSTLVHEAKHPHTYLHLS